MKQSEFNKRLDKDVKDSLEEFCDDFSIHNPLKIQIEDVLENVWVKGYHVGKDAPERNGVKE